jgi:hypothetical protein
VIRPERGIGRMLAGITRDPRTWLDIGHVTDVQSDRRWGYRLFLTLADGREIEARPGWIGNDDGRGEFWRIAKGAEVVVVFPGGDINAGIATPIGPASSAQSPGDGWDGTHDINGVPLYVREQGDTVEGVLRRELLDYLLGLTTDINGLADAIESTATSALAAAGTPPVTLANCISAIVAINTNIASLLGAATALKVTSQVVAETLDTSRQGEGGAPFVSTLLKVRDS